MKAFRSLLGMVLVIGASLAAGRALGVRAAHHPSSAAAVSAQTAPPAFPKDLYPETGNRLPAIRRDDLDDAGKKLFDARGTADFFGPGAIRLYSPAVADHMGAVNDYLRNKSGLDPRLVQLAILVTAREFDSEYVWNAHESQGVKAGLGPEIIDVVKYHKPSTGLAEKDAVLIELGRQVISKHHVDSATAAHALSLFGKQKLVEYVSLLGDYAATAILLNAFDQHVRPAEKSLLPVSK